MDGMAFVGPATSGKPDLLVATGFNAWGITQGAVAGEILAARILEKIHPCADLYDATRVKPVAGGPTFVMENVKTAAHLAGERLLGSRISKLADIAQGEGGVIRHKGEQLAVLKDADGAVTARSAICTHLGCVVGWNAIDRTWDCSCHGSRFDADGAVLSGPATAPLEARALAGAKTRS
jgi:Rieske Fe-S protein